jgi:large subunit ribosomal protein L22
MSPTVKVSEAMLVEASLKFIHMAPMKLRRVVNEIRGKQVDEALTILNFAPQRASKVIEKLLKSAIANAVNNQKLAREQLTVANVQVGQAYILKRFRARSRGMAAPRQKKWSHVWIHVSERN